MRTLLDLNLIWRDVGQEPVRELCARKIGRDFTILLIHVVPDARCVEIDAGDHERLGTVRNIRPSELWVHVPGEGHVTFIGGFGQGVGRSDRLAVVDRATCQLHDALLSLYWHNSRVRTSFIILGSGQDGGAPQVGLHSSVQANRTASSVAVVGDSGAVVLLDASPDLRLQSCALVDSPLYPQNRDFFLDGVFITHAHMGHYAGLLHFGDEAAATDHMPLFGTQRFLSFMESNEPWAALTRNGHLDATPIDGMEVAFDDSLSVSAIPVPHREEYSDTVALSVSVAGQPWMLYLPDIDDWQSWKEAENEIARHDVALLDATFSSVDELPGRDVAAIRHPLVPDTVERFGHLTSDTHVILTHINHSNPLGDPHAIITQLAVDAGFTVAFDGFESSTGT